MRYSVILAFLIASICLNACCGTRITGVENRISHPLARIAALPVGGELADEIAVGLGESKACTVEVLDTEATGALLTELGISSLHLSQPKNLERMKARGVDACLRIESMKHLINEVPSMIEVRLFSTHDPRQSIQFEWHNSWGGFSGSIADNIMRSKRATAVKEVVAELVRRLERTRSPKS